ncbi:MAG: 50S ribosomal protein L21 [Parcubacteria group bacterium GW2011_GWA2_38_13b]|nr:MAG: 50S ribosomal protein L21 [Parcubacteria group bacterium GW2011_GWA2_38_13b]
MLAIIKTGGKQYKVKAGDKIKIEKIEGEIGTKTEFGEVLLLADEDGKEVKIGAPFINGVKVEGKILKQDRGDKVIIFKYKAKKRYHKKQGHRQDFTEVEITKI